MINFSEEIFNRPKREWIVSKGEKLKIRDNAKKLKTN